MTVLWRQKQADLWISVSSMPVSETDSKNGSYDPLNVCQDPLIGLTMKSKMTVVFLIPSSWAKTQIIHPGDYPWVKESFCKR